LRYWIKRLEDEGELCRINSLVDWDGEIAEIQRRNLKRQGPALLFESIKGHQDTWCSKLFCGGQATLGRTAMMMGLPKGTAQIAQVQELRKRFRNPIKPVITSNAPVKENIIASNDINLFQIPVPKWHHLDNGRYINTWGGVVTRDPKTGKHNLGVYRAAIKSRNKINVMLVAAQDWGIHYDSYRQRHESMPVAMIFGWDPSMVFTGGMHLSGSEYEIMGAITGEPVPLIQCETSELLVPASAEIVVEGFISPDSETYEMEGPYGESTGYYSIPRKRPVLEVSCITHRNNPIFRGAINESRQIITVGNAALIWNVLEDMDLPGILDVRTGGIIAVKIHKTYQGQARQIAAAIWGSRVSVTGAKLIIVVDDENDIDITDTEQLLATVQRHVDPVRDVIVYPMELGTAVDQSLSVVEQDEQEFGQALGNKLLIDATVNWKIHFRNKQWGGLRLSPDCNKPSGRIGRLVTNRWQEYEIPD